MNVFSVFFTPSPRKIDWVYVIHHLFIIIIVKTFSVCLKHKVSHKSPTYEILQQLYIRNFTGCFFNVLDTTFDIFIWL